MNMTTVQNVVLAVLGLFLTATFIPAAASASETPQVCSTVQSGNISSTLNQITGVATLTNRTQNCIFNVGLASYKMFHAYSTSNKDWLYSQELFDHALVQVEPGKTITLNVSVPTCSYQIDLFQGELITKFGPGVDYQLTGPSRGIRGEIVIADGLCVKPTPTPSPTPTPTPTPSPTPTAIPTITPTPTPQVLSEVTELPSTGPGSTLVVTLSLISAAIIGRKATIIR